ncbi:glycosyltransferase [candidate division GN15 bacterium]|nr:glycosyltransferase [candidate division GN15 bacterium]
MSESTIQLSVVIPVYNGQAYLKDCLSSLLEDLAGVRHEVIVVDDGSTDESIALVQEHCSSCRLIELDRNYGFTRAVNVGLEAATGEYILLLNQDTRVHRGAVPALIHRLSGDESIGVIGPKFVSFDDETLRSARAFPTYRHVWYDALLLSKLCARRREFGGWRMSWFDHESETVVDQPMGAAMLFRRRLLDAVGSFDESYPLFFSDVDFCHRLVGGGYRNVYYPPAVVAHAVGGATSQRPIRSRVQSHASLYRFLRRTSRWWSRPVLWLTGVVLWLGLVPSLFVMRGRRNRP